MSTFWKDKNVVVTGGTGFIGSFVVEMLVQDGAKVTVPSITGKMDFLQAVKDDITLVRGDLSDQATAVKMFSGSEVVLHLASKVAGITYNLAHPSEMFFSNVRLGLSVIEAARLVGVERLLVTSSACVYKRDVTVPTPENEGFLEDPEPTNLGYGWSKRVLELGGRFEHLEHGMKVAIARPYNGYGPRDDFDPTTSHVIPGIIRRVYGGESPLTVWGSGKQTRSFLYVEDFARGLLEIVEKYPECDPINLGADEEISMGELAKLIVELSGKKIDVQFDTSRPDGQPRRKPDLAKLKEKVGFSAKTSLRDGLKQTINWYQSHIYEKNN